MDLARRKAQALVESGRLDPLQDHLILAADTIVFHENEVLGKPKDRDEAVRTLQRLSGRTHQVITAFCLWNTSENKHVEDQCTSEVTFRRLEDEEIHAYVATGDPMDKAGSYGIQSLRRESEQGLSEVRMEKEFVEKFTGTLENIAGLPVDAVEKLAAKHNWDLPRS